MANIDHIDQLIKNYNNPPKKFADVSARAAFIKNILEEIINQCDNYISSIPLEDRTRTNESIEQWEERLSLMHPNLLSILKIQKKAVSLLYLPEAETDAKARWKLLKEIFNLGSGHGKRLDEKYWRELKYIGEMAIVHWVMESNYESQKEKLSFSETIQRDKAKVGIDKQTVNYFNKPEDYQVHFDDYGKMYFNNQILDTTQEQDRILKKVSVFSL